jgi:hypothetical protein
MTRVPAAVLLIVLPAWAARAADAPARGPLSVFVQARPDEAEPNAAAKADLQSRSEASWKSAVDLDKSLRKQFGKDRAKWPADQLNQWYETYDAAGKVWGEAYYYARPAAEKADSVADFQKRLNKKKWVTLAAKPEDADLIIEVMGRKGFAKFMAGPKYLGFDVRPGKVPAATVVTLPREQFKPWFEDKYWTLHWPRSGEEFFRFEVNDTERWSDVAGFGIATVEELAKTYYDTLKP